ncbi:uncharacterized protein ACIBXB_019071 isoform 1-T1 [Morphnus guianensis]
MSSVSHWQQGPYVAPPAGHRGGPLSPTGLDLGLPLEGPTLQCPRSHPLWAAGPLRGSKPPKPPLQPPCTLPSLYGQGAACAPPQILPGHPGAVLKPCGVLWHRHRLYPSFPPSVAFVGWGGPGCAAGWGDLGRVGGDPGGGGPGRVGPGVGEQIQAGCWWGAPRLQEEESPPAFVWRRFGFLRPGPEERRGRGPSGAEAGRQNQGRRKKKAKLEKGKGKIRKAEEKGKKAGKKERKAEERERKAEETKAKKRGGEGKNKKERRGKQGKKGRKKGKQRKKKEKRKEKNRKRRGKKERKKGKKKGKQKKRPKKLKKTPTKQTRKKIEKSRRGGRNAAKQRKKQSKKKPGQGTITARSRADVVAGGSAGTSPSQPG